LVLGIDKVKEGGIAVHSM